MNALSDTRADGAVTPYARRALFGAAAGYAMDGFDLLILGFMLPAIGAALRLTPGQTGAIVTWTLIGSVVGGVVFGALSDRFGRARVLTWTIFLFAVFTGLCAFAQSYGALLVYRTIAGLGLGGEFGIGMALVAECWPAAKRARASAYVGLGWQLGVLAAALLTPILLPVIGWRGMFIVGVLPALAAWFMRRSLHEPETFITAQSHRTAKPNWIATFKLLFADTRTAKLSLGCLVLCSVQNFGYYGISIWLPSYLSKTLGLSLMKSGLWTSATVVGMMIGIWAFGQLADRIGRKPSFLLFQAGAALMVCVYAMLSTPMAILCAGIVMGAFVNGMLGGYGTLMSEGYPTAARATAQNVLWNAGRAVGGFGPLVIGTIATAYSFQTAIALLATLYVVDMLATWFLVPEMKGQALH
jgi:benzoate transport